MQMLFSGDAMKKLLVSSIAALGLIGKPALAADMAVKAPPPPPAPVYSWTGCYVGANGGGVWNSARSEGDVRRDPARLVFAEQLGRRSPARFAFVIDIPNLLPASVTHDEAVGRDFGMFTNAL